MAVSGTGRIIQIKPEVMRAKPSRSEDWKRAIKCLAEADALPQWQLDKYRAHGIDALIHDLSS